MRRMKGILCGLAVLCCLLNGQQSRAAGEVVLPENLTVVQAEAFRNAPVETLVIPEGVKRIESKAFAGCPIESVVFPESLEYIAPDAFDAPEKMWATVVSGSYAAEWCDEHNAIVSRGLGVTYRTPEEIRAFAAAHPADTTTQASFRQEPEGGYYSSEPYAPGLLSEKSIADGINMLNQVRFAAGLNADVVHQADRELMMGAAALVHGLNGTISHYPERPEELSGSRYDELYELACTAAKSSNLSAGRGNMASAVLHGYMYDGGSNMATVGHRRWILNPSMKNTTFGFYYASGTRYWYYSGMYAFDSSGSGRQTLVAWPAQQTPLEYFTSSSSHPWSLSFGRILDESAISVKLVRESDGKTWRFSSESADGAFYVNNDWYGQPGCVIFLPDGIGSVSAGEVFHVSVEDAANRMVVQYTVRFFEM